MLILKIIFAFLVLLGIGIEMQDEITKEEVKHVIGNDA